MKPVFGIILRTFDLSGTETRRAYWTYIIFIVCLTLAIELARALLVLNGPTRGVLTGLIVLLNAPLVALSVRRLHDAGHSGKYAGLLIVPGLNLVFAIVTGFLKSSENIKEWPTRPRHWIGRVLVLIFAALLFGREIYAPYWIPSGAMKPTLLIGDYILVSSMSGLPARGDVVVFRHPTNGSDFIKRVVGLPSDRIQVTNGVLSINGEVAVQTPVGTFEEVFERQGPLGRPPSCQNGAVGQGAICEKTKLTEVFPDGHEHFILNIGTRSTDDTKVFTVPEGQFFAMGDNRDNSSDSRVPRIAGGIGYVPIENVVGRADRVLFSSSGRRLFYFWTWRPDRFWGAIK